MKNDPLVRWLYMREGDMLEYKDRYGNVKQIGPVSKIDWRPDQDQQPTHLKKFVMVPALRDPDKQVSVPLMGVQAVFRNGTEIVRFSEDEKQEGFSCQICYQRRINGSIPGSIFCSLACKMEWVERYYGDYPAGQNPIDKGEKINFANCGECRKLNRVYCPNCVD